MTQVTSLGFLRTRLDERLDQLKEAYRNIYGQDISIEPDDMDGQFLGILSERLSDLDQLAEDIYNSFNPQLVTGVSQSRLVQLNGIRRIAGTYSTADATLNGTPGVTVPAGSLVKSSVDNTSWATTADAIFDGNGLATVTLKCVTLAAIAASATTLTKIDTPIYGWFSVTNANAATVGRAEETDEELRIRRKGSTNTPALCIVDAVYGGLTNLSGVRLARVYENATDVVDGNGQAAHSIYCVVEGGVAADIAALIWKKKTAGTTTIGTTSTVVNDSQGLPHTVKFSGRVYSDFYITVNVTKRRGYPTDGAARIKAALVAYGLTLGIGEPSLDSRLYTPVNTIPNHFITTIYQGLAPAPASAGNITPTFDGLIRIDASRIVVNET
jgi:uncharacterized phage protein gp47/JayE